MLSGKNIEGYMTTYNRVNVVCECGHRGIVTWKENDQPFSKQYEEYSISGFDGGVYHINGISNVTEALKHIKPKCPDCGLVGKVKNA